MGYGELAGNATTPSDVGQVTLHRLCQLESADSWNLVLHGFSQLSTSCLTKKTYQQDGNLDLYFSKCYPTNQNKLSPICSNGISFVNTHFFTF